MFKKSERPYLAVLFGAFLIFALLFVFVMGANAQESTEEPSEWACAYEHFIDYRIELVGENYTMEGTIVSVDNRGRCAYFAQIGDVIFELTYDELTSSKVTPPWCTDSLLGRHEMWGKWEGVTILSVSYILPDQECILFTDRGTTMNLREFVLYLEGGLMNSFWTTETIQSEGFIITNFPHDPVPMIGFGSVLFNPITSQSVGCFKATGCEVSFTEGAILLTFHVYVKDGDGYMVYDLPEWILHDYVREFYNPVMVYP